jgi:tuberculosinol/isotuberculosinol synthase
MDQETFLNLPTEEIADLVRERGPRVCVFPINGTRRWFMLEHADVADENFVSNYRKVMVEKHLEIYRLFFDHGINYLLTPIFGPDLFLDRSEDYVSYAVDSMALLARHPDFLHFYQEYNVRVRCYGDYEKYLASSTYEYLSDVFEDIMNKTSQNYQYYLLFGVFAHDATETIARISVDYYQNNECLPNKDDIVKLYYGVSVPSVDVFIGFDKFAAFDMPLIATGNEDLYFTVSPSLYMSKLQLRSILYDHIYKRQCKETDYEYVTEADWEVMRTFYHNNNDNTLGVGAIHPRANFWYPLPQVKLPE